MKIIITESQKILLEMSPSVRRRLHMADYFIKSLSPSDIRIYWGESEGDEYVRQILSDAVWNVIDDDKYYDEVYNYLSNKYGKHIREFFYDSL
jgi:hypothetical protein